MNIRIIKNATPDRIAVTDVFVEIDCNLRATVPHRLAEPTGEELYATAIERMRCLVHDWDQLQIKQSA